MSATLVNPLPMPGLAALCQVVSCVPRGVVSGEPTFRPWPGIVLQFAPSVRPAVAQVAAGLRVPTTPLPGNERYFEAILPAGAKAASATVSNQPLPWRAEMGSRTLS